MLVFRKTLRTYQMKYPQQNKAKQTEKTKDMNMKVMLRANLYDEKSRNSPHYRMINQNILKL